MIDLIVVDYRSPADLDRFLRSLPTQNLDDELHLSVVKVDPNDGGWTVHDLHEDTLKALDGTLTKISATIHLDNVGYNVACNAAGADMDGDIIICCNADVAFTDESPDTIQRLADSLYANQYWGIIGPRQINRQRRITAAGIFGPLDAPRHRGWHDRNPGQYDDIRDDATIVAGSVFAMRRNTWELLTNCPLFQELAPGATGPFLPTKHFWGETYACAHAHGHGLRRVYLGTVWCYHEVRGAPGSARWANTNLAADRAYFARACEAHNLPHDQGGRHG